MPNYKISHWLKDHIKAQVKAICSRRVAYAQDDFPLTMEQIQAHCMGEEALEKLEWLKSYGITSLPLDQDPLIAIDKRQFAIKRNVLLHTYLPDRIFADSRSSAFFTYGTDLAATKNIPPGAWLDPSKLDDTTVGKLRAWIEGVVRELRLQDVTNGVVERMLDVHLSTSGHLMTRWPVLATVIDDKEWKMRLHRPPVRTKPFEWVGGKPSPSMEPWLKAAEAVILGGGMLAPHEYNATAVRANITQWERLPTDKQFSW